MFPVEQSRGLVPEHFIGSSPLDLSNAGSLGGSEGNHPASLSILRNRQAEGQAVDVVVFPNSEHGIIERQDGEPSLAGRHSPGYLELLSEWIRSRRLTGPYGLGEVDDHSTEGPQ